MKILIEDTYETASKSKTTQPIPFDEPQTKEIEKNFHLFYNAFHKKLIEYNIQHQQEETNEEKKAFIDHLKHDPDQEKMAFLELQTDPLLTQEKQTFHPLYLFSKKQDTDAASDENPDIALLFLKKLIHFLNFPKDQLIIDEFKPGIDYSVQYFFETLLANTETPSSYVIIHMASHFNDIINTKYRQSYLDERAIILETYNDYFLQSFNNKPLYYNRSRDKNTKDQWNECDDLFRNSMINRIASIHTIKNDSLNTNNPMILLYKHKDNPNHSKPLTEEPILDFTNDDILWIKEKMKNLTRYDNKLSFSSIYKELCTRYHYLYEIIEPIDVFQMIKKLHHYKIMQFVEQPIDINILKDSKTLEELNIKHKECLEKNQERYDRIKKEDKNTHHVLSPEQKKELQLQLEILLKHIYDENIKSITEAFNSKKNQLTGHQPPEDKEDTSATYNTEGFDYKHDTKAKAKLAVKTAADLADLADKFLETASNKDTDAKTAHLYATYARTMAITAKEQANKAFNIEVSAQNDKDKNYKDNLHKDYLEALSFAKNADLYAVKAEAAAKAKSEAEAKTPNDQPESPE